MTNFEKIKQILDEKNIPHQFLTVTTDQFDVDSHVRDLGIKYREGLSTLLFKVKGKEYIAVLRRDDRNINSKALKKLLGTGDFTFCTDEDMKLLGIEPGLASPFILDLKYRQSDISITRLFVDNVILEMDDIICGSCSPKHPLKLKKDDLLNNIGKYEVADITTPNSKRQDKEELDLLERKGKSLRILSGITPSSSKGLHLGNYLGAVKPQVEFQDKGQCFYFIADYHALNTVFDPTVFANNVYETYLDYLALGIDLSKTVFFVESHVQSIFELTEILNNVVTLSEMKRMHAYKDKLADPNADVDNINMGLFNYPILMAADILLFEPDIVPVGEDQAQHVEICREIARSFNNRYGNTIKVPDLYIKKEVARVPGTDGVRKMSKSLGNDLTIFGDEKMIYKQIMSIVTDPNRIHKNDPGNPDKNVIFKYFRLMDYNPPRTKELEENYRKGSVGDVELKEEFYKFFLEYFKDFRLKRKKLAEDKQKILNLMKENAVKANSIAESTIRKIREAIGAIYI